MKFKIEKVANMVFISTVDDNVIFRAWQDSEFTERKLNNAIKKITSNYNGNCTFTRCF